MAARILNDKKHVKTNSNGVLAKAENIPALLEAGNTAEGKRMKDLQTQPRESGVAIL